MKKQNKNQNRITLISLIILLILLIASTYLLISSQTKHKEPTAYVALLQIGDDISCVNTGVSISEFRKTNEFMKLMKQPYYVECRLK